MELARERLNRKGILRACDLVTQPTGRTVDVAGVVICRQRPPTARGMMFLTLEDETGMINAAATPQTVDRYTERLVRSVALVVRAKVERESEAVSLLVQHAFELPFTGPSRSRDFH